MLDIDTLRALRGKNFKVTLDVEITGQIEVEVCAIDEEDAMSLATSQLRIEDAVESIDSLVMDVDPYGAKPANE